MKKTGTTWPLSILFWILCLTIVTFYLMKASGAGEKNHLAGMLWTEMQREAAKTITPMLELWENGKETVNAEECLGFVVPSFRIHAEAETGRSENAVDWLLAEKENEKLRSLDENEGTRDGGAGERAEIRQGPAADEMTEDSREMAEEIMETLGDTSAVRREKVRNVPPEQMDTFAALVKNFYVIDSTTMADESLLDAKAFLEKDVRIDKTVDGPQILIYHTHSREAFLDSKPGDPSETVVGVGEELARILEEEYGYQVLHHVEGYDVPSRNGAYSRALPEVQRLLEEHPSIQVVIDLHRDEMPENVHLVTEIDGKKTARFMFFNGVSQTKKTGPIDYLKNEYLMDNLAFSFQMEKAAQEYFPNLTRKIYLKGYRYNMHVCPRTLLIELGAQNNTLEEAMNACEPLAMILDLVLAGNN